MGDSKYHVEHSAYMSHAVMKLKDRSDYHVNTMSVTVEIIESVILVVFVYIMLLTRPASM